MKRSAAGVLLPCSLALGAASAWARSSQDDVEEDLARVLADPTRYSVEVIQREHQRYPGSSPVYRIVRGERPVAVLKCNSTAGTSVRASRATYELSRSLGLTTYSVTVLATPEFLSGLRQASGGAFDYAEDDCALKEYHVSGRFFWKEQKGQHFYRTRFDREFVERLRQMVDRLAKAKEDKSIIRRHYPYLDAHMRSGQYAPDYIGGHTVQVLDHFRQAEKRCGAETYFP